jgi:hypothetical protein
MTVVLIEKIFKHAYKSIYVFFFSSCRVIIIIEGIIADEIKEKKYSSLKRDLEDIHSFIYPVLLMTINQIYLIDLSETRFGFK